MKFDLVRVWKDEGYRQSLSDEQFNQLPENPAGALELNDAELESVYGGGGYDPSGQENNGWGNNGSHKNGWGSNGNHNRQQNSNICSILCSHDCNINILDLLNLRLG
ncbi:MAG TPA: mersacidin/lichenicidin family type 2 lantibiotic [Ktedonobacteraceae bacterium]|nr:mersacidin/lichenicidin family type 2 lantibiotic [Ktedonobacteraceae bacterium]